MDDGFPTLERRTFLKALSATVAGTAAVACTTLRCPKDSEAEPKLTFQIVRPADRLYIDVETQGFCIRKRGLKAFLVPTEASIRRQIAFVFPPQHFTESAIPVERAIPMRIDTSELEKIGLVASGVSRLVFQVPTEVKFVELSVESLLDWRQFLLLLPDLEALAQQPGPLGHSRRHFVGFDWFGDPQLAARSVVELPWGIYLQPLGSYSHDFRWTHSTKPVIRHGQTELWFTQLRGAKDGSAVNFEVLDVRGLKHQGFDPGVDADRYVDAQGYDQVKSVVECSPTTNWDRLEVAATLSRRFEYTGRPTADPIIDTDQLLYGGAHTGACYMPEQKVQAFTFALSSLGGWLDLRSEWHPKPGCALQAWNHQATLGRDHYVKYERAGFLYPLGIPATLVILTEREFIRDDSDHFVAPLMKQAFIRVPQPNALELVHGETPFPKISVTTVRTPPLDIPKYEHPPGHFQDLNLIDYAMCDYFLPVVGGQPFEFEFRGTDHADREATSRMPMYFVSNKAVSSNGLIREQGGVPILPPKPFVPEKKPAAPGTCAMHDPDKLPRDGGNFDPNGLGLRALDIEWQKKPFRFAQFHSTPVALAPPDSEGDTTNDVEWVEWVRAQVPKLKEGVAVQPFLPRARTVKLATPAMRQFSKQSTFMLATYRDVRFVGHCWLDPAPTLPDEVYYANRLRPDDPDNGLGSYLHVLPLEPVEDNAALYPFSAPNLDRTECIRNIYFGKSTAGSKHPHSVELFENLTNQIGFGRHGSSESLGALATPDSPIGLLTRTKGPVGDAVADRNRWKEATPKDKFAIPASRSDFIHYRLNHRSEQHNALEEPFDPPESQSTTANCRAFVDLYPDVTQGVNGKALYGPLAESGSAGMPGIADIASLFGVDAEIIPGVRLSRVLQGVTFGSQSPFAKGAERAHGTAPRWTYEISGLEEVLAVLGDGPGQFSLAEVQALDSEQEVDPEPKKPLPLGVKASLDWDTDSIKGLDLGFIAFVPHDSTFAVHASATMTLGSSKPRLEANAYLTTFDVIALNSLQVQFKRIAFRINASGKKQFTPELGEIRFKGPLAFIDNLKKLLKGLEDEFGIILSITPQEVSVSQKIMIPPGSGSQPGGTLQIGPAVITNLNFNWGVRIPLLGRGSTCVAVGVATREDPLTIYVPPFYGGKAHALMEVTTHGVRLFEASMEYGGLILVKYSIASGEVSIMAGIFLQLINDAGVKRFGLSAYVRITGSLDVARIITFSGLIMVSMTYEKTSGAGAENGSKIAGQSTVTVSMKIGFARISYSFTARHEERRREDSKQTQLAQGRQRTRLGQFADDIVNAGNGVSSVHSATSPPDECDKDDLADGEDLYLFRRDEVRRQWTQFVSAYEN